MANMKPGDAPLCPSAQPAMDGASVFGLVQGTATAPRVAYLDRIIPLTPAIAATAAPVAPTEVFRIGAPCASAGCQHFDDGRCRLAVKLVRMLPAAVVHAPPCALRPHCMWWRQEGVAACVRCPQIVTRMHGASAELLAAADPATPVQRPAITGT
jgi:hypothetical protein